MTESHKQAVKSLIFFGFLILGISLTSLFFVSNALSAIQEKDFPQHLSGTIIGLPLSDKIGKTYINLGQIHGVQTGMRFVVYRGGLKVGVLEVTSVQQRMSAVSVVEQNQFFKVEDAVELLPPGSYKIKRAPKAAVYVEKQEVKERESRNKEVSEGTIGNGPEKPVLYPTNRVSQGRIDRLEKRVADLEKLLALTLARIPQLSPELLASPPLPPLPYALGPSPEMAYAPPKEDLLGVPLPQDAAKGVTPTGEEDIWRTNTPYDILAKKLTVPAAVASAAQQENEAQDEWMWGTRREHEDMSSVPKVNLAVSLLESKSGTDLQGGAKFVPKPNFLECSNWELRILNSDGVLVKSYKGKDKLPDAVDWDGQNSSNEKMRTGLYAYVFKAETKDGQIASTNGEVPPRDPKLMEDKEWKYGSLYDEGSVGDQGAIKKARDESKGLQGVLLDAGKVVFTVALILLVL